MIKAKSSSLALLISAVLGLSACSEQSPKNDTSAKVSPQATAAEAKEFLKQSQEELNKLSLPAAQAAWAYQTYINQDTANVSAYLGERVSSKASEMAKESARFNNVEVDADTRRMLDLLRHSLVLPPPSDAKQSERLAQIQTDLEGMYGSGKYCQGDGDNKKCMTLTEMSSIMATQRDPELLLELWKGWREVSVPMKPLYMEEVEIANKGAQELGFADISELWRGKYDMKSDDFEAELDRLWGQVKPFYDALHCHVRAELGETYGTDIVPQDKPIPAHLLGNMWAQTWSNIYDVVKPEQEMKVIDVTKALEDNGYDEIKMVKQAEAFFTGLGFEPLPETFWERSMFQQPADRDVVCHASAWNLDNVDDLRIKMCIQKTGEEFAVIHHELGHNFYQRAYNKQPLLYQSSANDGFHEAIGDTIALSITPKYLKGIGLVDEIPDASNDIGMLLKTALDKIAFVPFGLLVDKWRWGVFSGKIKPEDYNKYWWELREQYQGVASPVERPADAFDPGAKYHIPGNTPYSRYFLAHILQFQFHRALCEIAGDEGPVHRCSIANNKEAGAALNKMLMMGQSKPWQEALEVLTGKPEMDATAILDYFAPLKTWLDEQNKGRQCGW
ncbi:M2 family metallopeptidase [Paraneptunicella aestuarii]|uniref:M2 family metallopeptidase n=1 Tax=Paraneptunicella aestuarii TaxID=2831148 RepID=UPI001E52BB73|nr:M2 family metallopeptidase [Paraneptunicella aestuarii]UAA40225.1 M2 family metallopeptidase [Paraneptunicella aestuarii]